MSKLARCILSPIVLFSGVWVSVAAAEWTIKNTDRLGFATGFTLAMMCLGLFLAAIFFAVHLVVEELP